MRCSKTDPTKPFTISKVNRQKVVTHQRISAKPDGSGYFVRIQGKSGSSKIECKGSIIDFIKAAAKDLYLKAPESGSMFSTLFVKEEKFGGYICDDE